jgi:hypothetical protein
MVNRRRRYPGAAEEALPTSDPSAGTSDQTRRCRRADLRLGLVRGEEEGDNDDQIQLGAAENRSQRHSEEQAMLTRG